MEPHMIGIIFIRVCDCGQSCGFHHIMFKAAKLIFLKKKSCQKNK